MRKFDGAFYEKRKDFARLDRQIDRVFAAVQNGKWTTVERIERLTNDPANSIQAQLRNLRKPENGGYTILSKRVGAIAHYKLMLENGEPVTNTKEVLSATDAALMKLSKAELVEKIKRLRKKIKRLQDTQ